MSTTNTAQVAGEKTTTSTDSDPMADQPHTDDTGDDSETRRAAGKLPPLQHGDEVQHGLTLAAHRLHSEKPNNATNRACSTEPAVSTDVVGMMSMMKFPDDSGAVARWLRRPGLRRGDQVADPRNSANVDVATKYSSA